MFLHVFWIWAQPRGEVLRSSDRSVLEKEITIGASAVTFLDSYIVIAPLTQSLPTLRPSSKHSPKLQLPMLASLVASR